MLIFAIITLVIFGIIIGAAVRRRLHINATYRRRLAGIGRYHTGGVVHGSPLRDGEIPTILSPGYEEVIYPGHPLYELARIHEKVEVTSGYRVEGRHRTARMAEMIGKADSMSFVDLSMAGVQLGMSPEVANLYASEDEGEPLPAAMAHSPNVGGEGNPEYRGGNYVEAEEIANEMSGIIHYPPQREQIWNRAAGGWIDTGRYQKD
jgi:hypothetical protein